MRPTPTRLPSLVSRVFPSTTRLDLHMVVEVGHLVTTTLSSNTTLTPWEYREPWELWELMNL